MRLLGGGLLTALDTCEKKNTIDYVLWQQLHVSRRPLLSSKPSELQSELAAAVAVAPFFQVAFVSDIKVVVCNPKDTKTRKPPPMPSFGHCSVESRNRTSLVLLEVVPVERQRNGQRCRVAPVTCRCCRGESVKCRNRRPENVHRACATSREPACYTTSTGCMIDDQDLEIVIGRYPNPAVLQYATSTGPSTLSLTAKHCLSKY
jgi:hypothetical protein